ncbi:UDP-glycosyltransferase 73B4-like [Euphorbia lathyris]|uniref:UDP-glycosyltransferase 73B4-like n=1 Tax=Euphorbia lathyris TaxID=212925 RepID=UPI00331317C3
MASTPEFQSHVVIFPFMAQGHTLPLLDLSKALSHKQIKVTIITTPGNSNSISQNISSFPHISITEIPFPTAAVSGLPSGCENTSQLPSMDLHLNFVLATKHLQNPFTEVLQKMVQSSEFPPICVISDFFLGWTLAVCESLGIPRLVFHGMGVLSTAICKTAWVHKPHLKTTSVNDPVELPGLKLPFSLTSSDLPETVMMEKDNPFVKLFEEIGMADAKSWGIIVNSFEELERSHIQSFEAFYFAGAKAWCLGPLFLYSISDEFDRENSIFQWLNNKTTPNSVIYVSFGTQAEVSESQLNEIGYGLEESGYQFIWVLRSKTWNFPIGLEEKKIGERGLIVREFVDQRRILSHRAIGGFLSHCGWNSVLESVSAGVPILGWPMMAEQGLNAKLIVEGLGAGVGLKRDVRRRDICDGVREIMGGEKGRIARERAEALGRVARRAVQKGGSSDDTLDKMIEQLRIESDKKLQY